MLNQAVRYNSAVKLHNCIAFNDRREFRQFSGNGITAIQHNVLDGVHEAWINCDVLTTHIAWRNGYKAFTDNTIADGSSWKAYLHAIHNICRYLDIPCFIVCGKESIMELMPDRWAEIYFKRHHYAGAIVAAYKYTGSLSFADEMELQDFVCRSYGNILDPCCGYGSIAVDILRHGKRGVLSDINAECLEYIQGRYCAGGVA